MDISSCLSLWKELDEMAGSLEARERTPAVPTTTHSWSCASPATALVSWTHRPLQQAAASAGRCFASASPRPYGWSPAPLPLRAPLPALRATAPVLRARPREPSRSTAWASRLIVRHFSGHPSYTLIPLFHAPPAPPPFPRSALPSTPFPSLHPPTVPPLHPLSPPASTSPPSLVTLPLSSPSATPSLPSRHPPPTPPRQSRVAARRPRLPTSSGPSKFRRLGGKHPRSSSEMSITRSPSMPGRLAA